MIQEKGVLPLPIMMKMQNLCALYGNRRLTVIMLSEQLNISKESIHTYARFLAKKVCAKFVPRSLTVDQKERRVEASQNFIKWADSHENF